ncbi:LCP family protein [Streptomyces fulvorobeus]|uniref:Membrane protein n=1 Tax=Streptomyces fulvorobeus TaxID=284028 RepID=A0A7J0C5A9_9ACTN|nr:LCP family protein [Streptomyces fulvorobeus]NYE40815.1 hypothetical protein [Streptomyces fulvorobeus]GFM97124.1 membrane protein [Streptomyces fulvorobeus]
MNDRQNPYDPYYQQSQIVGYDEYGQPVYQQPGQPQAQQPYDPYAEQPQQPQQGQNGDQGYGYDPYAQFPQQPQGYDPYAAQQPQTVPPYQPVQDAHPQEQGYGYGDYGQGVGGQQPAAAGATQQWSMPPQAPAPAVAPPEQERPSEPDPEPVVPGQRRAAPGYSTEQFSFIEEPDEDSEDVIDWLKFTESRSERREEARRRGRNRIVALIVVAVLVVVAGAGYLWATDSIPGLSGPDERKAAGAGAQQRDVIVVHLHNTKEGGTSTALLVDNATTGQGTTVLLPNSLALTQDDGSATTLGRSVEDDGSSATSESIDTLLGTDISGTWRLDTPYLENLVELVGNIEVDTDTDVPDAKKGASPLVNKGEAQTLSGQTAVAYATYRGPGEPEAKQLLRFGQVVRSVLRKLSEDPATATVTVQTLGQILDPSLPERDLGASLAKLAGRAKVGDYKTALLPVEPDGTLTEQTTNSVVKDVLGGTVKAPDGDSAVRVGIRNATGNPEALEKARVQLVNGGFAYVDGGKSETAASSAVTYRTPEDRAKATEVAKTLGLPTASVQKGEPAANAEVSVVLGQNYRTK